MEFLQIKEGGSNFWGELILQEVWIIWYPFCISILKVLRTQILRHSLDFNAFCMIHEKFLQIGGPNFWGEPILQKVWIIRSPLLYFNFKSFMDTNSLSFIRFPYSLHDLGVLFSEPWNICKLKTGNLISGEEPILQKVLIIWSPLLYFNFKSFMDRKSLSFIRFQCILHDSGVLFLESWNFYRLKR